jgi:hypothetical protein
VLDDDTVMVDEQGEEVKPVPQKQEMTPLSIMKRALGMASYDNLVITRLTNRDHTCVR